MGRISQKRFKQGARNFTLIWDSQRNRICVISWHFSKFEKIADNAERDGFVCIKSNAVSKASSNFSSDISNVFELSGVAFHLAAPYGGLIVR